MEENVEDNYLLSFLSFDDNDSVVADTTESVAPDEHSEIDAHEARHGSISGTPAAVTESPNLHSIVDDTESQKTQNNSESRGVTPITATGNANTEQQPLQLGENILFPSSDPTIRKENNTAAFVPGSVADDSSPVNRDSDNCTHAVHPSTAHTAGDSGPRSTTAPRYPTSVRRSRRFTSNTTEPCTGNDSRTDDRSNARKDDPHNSTGSQSMRTGNDSSTCSNVVSSDNDIVEEESDKNDESYSENNQNTKKVKNSKTVSQRQQNTADNPKKSKGNHIGGRSTGGRRTDKSDRPASNTGTGTALQKKKKTNIPRPARPQHGFNSLWSIVQRNAPPPCTNILPTTGTNLEGGTESTEDMGGLDGLLDDTGDFFNVTGDVDNDGGAKAGNKGGGDFFDNLFSNYVPSQSTPSTPAAKDPFSIGDDGQLALNFDPFANETPSSHRGGEFDFLKLCEGKSFVTENFDASLTLQPYAHAYNNKAGRRWKPEEERLFYRAIRRFGSDLMLVKSVMPSSFTDKQLSSKFKIEEKRNPRKMEAALTTKRRRLTTTEFESLNGAIDESSHYRVEDDPDMCSEDELPPMTLSKAAAKNSSTTTATTRPEDSVPDERLDFLDGGKDDFFSTQTSSSNAFAEWFD